MNQRQTNLLLRIKVLLSGEFDIDLILACALFGMALGILVIPKELFSHKLYEPMAVLISTKTGWIILYVATALLSLSAAWRDSERRIFTVSAMGVLMFFQMVMFLRVGWMMQVGLYAILSTIAFIGILRNTTRRVNGRATSNLDDCPGRDYRRSR